MAIELRNVSRIFGRVRALDGITLEIPEGEFFALLGPSGSGKTTCLRIIAGFDQPSAGQVLLDGEDVTGVPPYLRNVNTVFQDYALFPHMSVVDNVAYGPRVRKVDSRERRTRALEMLALVRLDGFAARMPSQLSGGQKQRVALARALINHPKVLLLDEPLGALDLKLREAMQTELKALQERLGITFVYVTHDQGEALSMADRVAVFSEGRVEQLDRPRELYVRPRTAFVARFVGSANVIDGELAARLTGRRRPFAIRPELVDVVAAGHAAPSDSLRVVGTLEAIQYHGARSRWQVRVADDTMLTADRPESGSPDAQPRPGERVTVWFATANIVPLAET